MALTAEEKQKIRALLAKEEAQKKESILSSLESFAKWLRLAGGIVASLQQLQPVFSWLCSLF
ncbi:hypothetical protein QUB37_15575 [Microcoleus sp. AT3-A2]|uniref:hypothetical protein n=1 Tax=Microcoleus sp. AT3-A2 TaxID=2818610 RepID=UPI002FD2AF64